MTNPIGPTHEVPKTVDNLLLEILSTRRADGSPGDSNFRMWLQNMFRKLSVKYEVAEKGNFIVEVGEGSETLFSCHIDTCHSVAESNGQSQMLMYDNSFGHIFLDPKSNSGCLGADDGVGIWIMLKMIEAGVPGAYLFHTGEEVGCTGSKALLKARKEWLSTFSRAVAFDRPNNFEVIITQGGLKCASEEAGEDLANALNELGMDYSVSIRGVLTDTKVYAHVIKECFNLGVGYYQQHTNKETLDYAHANALCKAAIKLKWDDLIVSRVIPEPPKPAEFPKFPSYNWKTPKSVKSSLFDDVDAETYLNKPRKTTTLGSTFPPLFGELSTYDFDELVGICADTPEEAARIILRLRAKVEGQETELKVYYDVLGVA